MTHKPVDGWGWKFPFGRQTWAVELSSAGRVIHPRVRVAWESEYDYAAKTILVGFRKSEVEEMARLLAGGPFFLALAKGSKPPVRTLQRVFMVEPVGHRTDGRRGIEVRVLMPSPAP